MKTRNSLFTFIIAVAALLAGLLHPGEARAVSVSYLYKLSNFQGIIKYAGPKMAADVTRRELYVVAGYQVSVFNAVGMEVYTADIDPEVGMLYDLAFGGTGDIYALYNKGGRAALWLCDYRLEPQRTIELRGFPPEYAGFSPDLLRCRGDRLYLADAGAMKIVVTDLTGQFIKGYDIVALFTGSDAQQEKDPVRRKKKIEDFTENGLGGFDLDGEGNMVFVLPVSGRAARLSPDGNLELFGKRGSAPGKFGIPTCIVADRNGYYLVSDKLRSQVLIFNKDLKFVREFNYLGGRGTLLVAPEALAVGAGGKVYVGQVPARGVNVYQLDDGS